MVVIPAGRFTMGSPLSEEERYTNEGPTREVSLATFALGRYEITRAQFQVYATEAGAQITGCSLYPSRSWQSPDFEQTPSDPVVCVNWDDANAFVKWLGQRAKQTYRLASEAEWEYAARAGTTTRRYWGNSPSDACAYENVFDQSAVKSVPWKGTPHECADAFARTSPAGRFKPNAFGLYDMLGNAREWTQDCWNDSYLGGPTNGGPWTTGDCTGRVSRGGYWGIPPSDARSATRSRSSAVFRSEQQGFRVARALP
jgi:formylglycine-generating enzyme required for sulfatase activity